MRILVACEESQEVTKAFRALGHEAYSCDLVDCSGGHPEWHIKGDALVEAYSGKYDLMVAHPPCTRLCNSGVRWLGQRNLWAEMKESAEFFRKLMDAPIRYKVIENPVPHKYALEIIGRKYDQIIQPWQFGHGETKATCLWLENLPPLKPTEIVDGRHQRMHLLSPSKDRAKIRSKTYTGIAKAIAEQYSQITNS
jgi:hypothetical protein